MNMANSPMIPLCEEGDSNPHVFRHRNLNPVKGASAPEIRGSTPLQRRPKAPIFASLTDGGLSEYDFRSEGSFRSGASALGAVDPPPRREAARSGGAA